MIMIIMAAGLFFHQEHLKFFDQLVVYACAKRGGWLNHLN